MEELNRSRTFVHVVDSGSFSAAARDLNTSVTSVARQVTSLEAMLGVPLLNRTTRQQSLTEAGQLYYSRMSNILTEVDGIVREVSSYQQAVKGCLRIHLRPSIGNQLIIPALPRFFEQYPGLTLDITLTDEHVDLVAQGVDVAVWIGNLADSSLIARRLTPGRRVLCASPAYIERKGCPRTPQDLKDHSCILYYARNRDKIWRFAKDGETIEIPVSGHLQTDSGAALLTSALSGLGLVITQETIAREALREGSLVRVLADYDINSTEFDIAVYAVYPAAHRVSPKTRAFVDFLTALFDSD